MKINNEKIPTGKNIILVFKDLLLPNYPLIKLKLQHCVYKIIIKSIKVSVLSSQPNLLLRNIACFPMFNLTQESMTSLPA